VNILVFGAGGQVGHEVGRAAWPASWHVAALDRAAADITQPRSVEEAFARERPDLVVNLAAYTAVDRAESEPDAAWAANETGARHVARRCAAAKTPLVHLSTDYVFDGSKAGPYREDDPVNPIGVYGRSKEAGEHAVREALAGHVILRTAWIFGSHGGNFVKTMLRLGAERPELRVVADQRGSPTAAADIAAALVAIARQVAEGAAAWGTFHFAGAGATSWHGFAEAIFDAAAARGRPRPRVAAIGTADYPTAARRPANSVLDCGRIARQYGIAAPDWRPALEAVLDELIGAGADAGASAGAAR
jgi:dTDP-4-dehydrorhamnose reductase